MTILADTTGWSSIIENVLLVVHVVICLLLCLTVLMQRPKQEGLGAAFGGGMTDQAFGARTTDVLQKGTVYLATILFVITLILSILVGTKSRDTSFADDVEASGAAAIENNGDAAVASLADEEVTDSLEEAVNEVTKTETEAEEKPAEEKPAEETPVAPTTPSENQ